VVIGLYYIINV